MNKNILWEVKNYEVTLDLADSKLTDTIIFYIEIDDKYLQQEAVANVVLKKPLTKLQERTFSFFLDYPLTPFYSPVKIE